VEIDLLKKFPKLKRNLDSRKKSKNQETIEIARKFGKDFFDGDKKYGYGGHFYDEKYWSGVVDDFIDYYKLDNHSSILDVGCAKGFMLFEFKKKIPGAKLVGLDISSYAIQNCKEEIKNCLIIGDAKKLNFPDNSFDLVIAINTIHNLDEYDCGKSLREIQRVSKKNSYVVVDAYSNEIEKEQMLNWNLTGKTIKHVDEWKKFFIKNRFCGDYYWFKP
jgi:ubiquinone/menaquinone biosynthesis C-methylase UbiE